MIGYIFSILMASCWTTTLWGQKHPYSIPQSVFLQAGLNTSFVAKFALFIGILLAGTIIVGKLLKYTLRIPIIAGEILGGIVLGPSLINIAQLPIFAHPFVVADTVSQKLYTLIPSDLYVFFVLLLSAALTVSYLLWLAGYETNLKDLIKVGATAVAAGTLGAFIPIGLIGGFLYYFLPHTYGLVSAIGIGLIFAATSVSIPVAMLVSSNKMHLKSSQATLGAAIIDDIVAVVMVSVFMMSVQTGVFGKVPGLSHHVLQSMHSASLMHSLIYMALCSLVILAFGFFFIPLALDQIRIRKLNHLMAPAACIIMLFYFAFVELVGGLAGITGAYFAGLFHRTGDKEHTAERVAAPFVNGILLPLFLGSIGLQIDISVLSMQEWKLVGILLVLAIISKLFACYVATQMSNLSGRRRENDWKPIEIYLFGSSMVARGEVGLVIATILRGASLLTPQSYVLCVVVIVLTTIATPIMLSIGFAYADQEDQKKHYKLNIGRFKAMGTEGMFDIIARVLEKEKKLNTTVTISEGRQIIDLEEHKITIFLLPSKGIIFEGDQAKIQELVAEIKHDLRLEIEHIKES
ncbi:MAG: Kef-type K+ transport system membrane component KefB [Alteromonas naphthalenivorans]|jgi:Kef-type K+ transport system membrane component KefB